MLRGMDGCGGSSLGMIRCVVVFLRNLAKVFRLVDEDTKPSPTLLLLLWFEASARRGDVCPVRRDCERRDRRVEEKNDELQSLLLVVVAFATDPNRVLFAIVSNDDADVVADADVDEEIVDAIPLLDEDPNQSNMFP